MLWLAALATGAAPIRAGLIHKQDGDGDKFDKAGPRPRRQTVSPIRREKRRAAALLV